MNIRLLITFLHGRFIYVHTFFHCKIMCSCRLITCLYDIQQTSYERRFHHSHVAPPEPIWAEFTSTIYKICQWSIRAATNQQSRHIRLRRASLLYICTYFPGENDDVVIRTRTHEKIQLDFFRSEPLYILYITGKNVKNCKVRSRLCALDPSIFHFIWAKHGGKIW